MSMKLSIVIPIYRTQDTLHRCLRSVLEQSFTDYEMILVDDGSPDECPRLCDEYAEKDKRIIVIHKENGGLSDARNAGIERAKGEYITFIDSDDAIQKDTFQPLIHQLYQHPDVDILEYPVMERIGHPQKERLLTFTPHRYSDALEYWLTEKAYQHTYAWNKIYKRSLFDDVRFPKGMVFEDALTLPHLIGLLPRATSPVHFAEERNLVIQTTNVGCYLYHWNDKGITATTQPKDIEGLYRSHNAVLQNIFAKAKENESLLDKYTYALQDFMAQILNLLLDLYEMTGKYVDNPPLIEYTRLMHNKRRIKTFKLKILTLLGYQRLCKINRLIHKIYRHP